MLTTIKLTIETKRQFMGDSTAEGLIEVEDSVLTDLEITPDQMATSVYGMVMRQARKATAQFAAGVGSERYLPRDE